MTEILCVVAAGCIVLSVIIVVWNFYQTRKTMDKIEEMLEAAKKGNFSEKRFDERKLSSLETKFAQYLSASFVAQSQIETEKDRIKTMISDISHQTKTPIANLLLYSELLREQDLDEESQNYVSVLYSQTKKLRFLIDTLIKLSRLENGILKMNVKRSSIQSVLTKIEKQYASLAEEKGLFLKFEATKAEAVFDAKWLCEAVANIVENAVKYTRRGGVTVKVRAYELFTRIEIIDTGMGILEEEQAKIFQRFYRSKEVSEEEGLGIGLYLAREILQAQGGYIKLTSVRGEGSNFSIFLPKE